MPYIREDERSTAEFAPQTVGELNFAITRILTWYFKHRTEKNYQAINDIIGALECAKQEFYRRVAVPYEEEKRCLNGDVYEA